MMDQINQQNEQLTRHFAHQHRHTPTFQIQFKYLMYMVLDHPLTSLIKINKGVACMGET